VPFYPLVVGNVSPTAAGLSSIFLIAISVLVVLQRRARPYLIVGWLWYLGTMVPVIGLVQVGAQSRADRYTYLPLIGILLMVVWSLDELARRWGIQKIALAAAAIVIGVLTLLCRGQVLIWHDDLALWNHTLRVTEDNWRARLFLGLAEEKAGRFDAACDNFNKGFQLAKTDPQLRSKVGQCLLALHRPEEARICLEEGLRMYPKSAELLTALGIVYQSTQRLSDARKCYEAALGVDSERAEVHGNLGLILKAQGNTQEALDHLLEAVRLNPRNAIDTYNLGTVFEQIGQRDRAIDAYRRAIQLDPSAALYKQRLNRILRDGR
jgi:tetratricopeptide (TPR) repeat protein